MKALHHNYLIAAACAAIALSPVSALSQGTTDPNAGSTTSSPAGSDHAGDDTDYGWVGLLGLLGLAGLMRKRHDGHVSTTTGTHNR